MLIAGLLIGVAIVALGLVAGGKALSQANAANQDTLTQSGPSSDEGTRNNDLVIVDRQPGDVPTPGPGSTVYTLSYIESDLANLEHELQFTVALPGYVPDDMQLTTVRKVVNPNEEMGPGVELTYETSDGYARFSITETSPRTPVVVSVSRNKLLQEVDINGHTGAIYDPGGPAELPILNRAILQWSNGSLWFEMRGANLASGELLRVARSLAP